MYKGHRILLSTRLRSLVRTAAQEFNKQPWPDECRLAASFVARSAGVLKAEGWFDTLDVRPLRAPHYTVSEAGLVGGGNVPRPGDVSLAHGGVLLLDEIERFRPEALLALYRVLDAGEARFPDGTVYPARPAAVIARVADTKWLRAVVAAQSWFLV